jgi:hypothetical protein
MWSRFDEVRVVVEFVLACGLAVVIPLLASILEASRAVVRVFEVDVVGIFLLGSRRVAALLV